MQYKGFGPIIVCSDDDPMLTLAYFAARINLVTLIGFSIGKMKTMNFSETIAACDMKAGRYESW